MQSILEQTGLEKSKQQKVEDLSPQMRRKLSIAISIIHMPKLYLLSTSFRHLSDEEAEILPKFISKMVYVDQFSSLILTSNPEIALKLSTKIGILNNGKISYQGKVEAAREIFSQVIHILESKYRVQGFSNRSHPGGNHSQ